MTGVLQRIADEQAPPENPAMRWIYRLLWLLVGGLYIYNLYAQRDRLPATIWSALLRTAGLMATALIWVFCLDKICRWIAGSAWADVPTAPPPSPGKRLLHLLSAIGWFALLAVQQMVFGQPDHMPAIIAVAFGLLTAVGVGWALAARLGLVDRPAKPMNLSRR